MHMRRSRLESYEAILGTLIKKPLTVDRIAYEINMDCAVIKQRMEFLLKNTLVEERNQTRKTLYAITERGATVFKTLNFQKYLEKVATTIRMMDEALQTVPTITRYSDKTEHEDAK